MEVLFKGYHHEHILWHARKIHTFCKTIAAFHRYLKFMDLVDSGFTSVGYFLFKKEKNLLIRS